MSDSISRYRAPALDKGLDILELLAEHTDGLSQAEIAKALGPPPSEIYRMLDTLVRGDYLRRSSVDDRLVLGLKLFSLATRHPPMRRLLQAANEVTTEIAEATLQSCHLSLYRDGNLFVAVQADIPGRFGVSVRLGAAVDLLTTGSGLAMLAFQSEAWRTRMRAARGTRELPDVVTRVLPTVLKKGHVRRESSQTVGVTDLAVPLIGRTGHAVAVLSIPYIERLDPQDATSVDTCLRLLHDGAARLSAETADDSLGTYHEEEAIVV